MTPWKELGSDGKSCLLPFIRDILVNCLRQDMVPQDMCDAKIIILYNIKSTMSDCNNHTGISFLRVAGYVFALVVLPRLQKLAEIVYSESQ